MMEIAIPSLGEEGKQSAVIPQAGGAGVIGGIFAALPSSSFCSLRVF